MCGRYTITVTWDELLQRFESDNLAPHAHRPSYNVAPTQMVPVVTNDGTKNVITTYKWGLIPTWAKDGNIAFKTFNARAETVAEKPAFRKAIRVKRCLIPADSFYEWKKVGADKQPLRFQLKSCGIFGFAGLYEDWKNPDGEWVRSCSIITTTPNELVADVHDRMPVILRQEDEAMWLDREIIEPEFLRYLLAPYPAEEMRAYPVSKRVGNVRNNDADLIDVINGK